jgi:Transcriptional regulator, AbiEi antitoxin
MPGQVTTALARLAGRSKGVVTRVELFRAGLTRGQIDWRVQSGLLIPQYDGVYRVGHAAPSVECSYLAAVKACGEGALLCGRAAAHHFGVIKGSPPPPEVLVVGKRRIPGLCVRRTRHIDRRDATRRHGIPITTVARTLVDLAAELPPEPLAVAFHEAAVLYRAKPEHVEAALARRPNSPGAAELRRAIWGDTRVLLSELERGFIALLGANDLPLPETNIREGGHYVDCRWPQYPLTVELDTYRYHSTRQAWERDQRRERRARARGDEYRRYVWGDVFEEPDATVAELRQLLSTLPS